MVDLVAEMADIALSRSLGILMDGLMASSNTFLKTVRAFSNYNGGATDH